MPKKPVKPVKPVKPKTKAAVNCAEKMDITPDSPQKLPLVSATKTRNYMLHDPFIDWLDNYGEKHGFKKDSNEFKRELFKGGHDFEDKIVADLVKRFPGGQIEYLRWMNFDQRVMRTRVALSEGVPIIYQGGVINRANQSFGIPDLIIRGDYLGPVLGPGVGTGTVAPPFLPSDAFAAFGDQPLVSPNKYYIVDIKHSAVKLNKDGTVSNAQRVLPFKGQVLIYYEALKDMIGGELAGPLAFIWGKDGVVGRVESEGADAGLVGVSRDAIRWYQEVLLNGAEWDPYNPVLLEMCPNMNNYDRDWETVKYKIAVHHGELTLLWNVTLQERNTLWEAGIKSWRSRRFNVGLLTGKNADYQRVMSQCLAVNMSDRYPCLPLYIPCELEEGLKEFPDWRNRRDVFELFVDFETVDDTIFMIGCVYQGEYRVFGGGNGETDLLKQFLRFIEMTGEMSVRIIHWGVAEWTGFNKAVQRAGDDPELLNLLFSGPTIEWVDLHNHFLEIPVVVHGAFSFGLKEIARALYSGGCIATTWTDDMDGFAAMQMAREMTPDKLATITEYNRIDCMVLWEITEFLRRTIA